jgi:membrane protein YdbS with pleckstrin-like domain
MPINFSIFTHTKYTFEGKRDTEEVEIFLYSHWIIILMKTIFYGLLAFVPLIPLLIFVRSIIDHGMLVIALFFLLAYYMILWSLYFYEVMVYLLDTWIVTNERILDIVQKSFFVRTVSDIDLTRVQDISVETKGLIQTVFDFGDIEIQSAGAVNKFRFRQVAHPNMIKDRIMKLVNEAKEKSGKGGI